MDRVVINEIDYHLLSNSFHLMGDPREMTPRFGEGVREGGQFAEIFQALDMLDLVKGLSLIEEALATTTKDSDRLTLLRLKAEVLSTHDEIWSALVVYQEILRVVPDDLHALFLVTFYAHRNQLEGLYNYYLDQFRHYHPAWAQELLKILTFINRYRGCMVLENSIQAEDDFDCLVLCGNTVEETGLPSDNLLTRLNKFLEMAEKYPQAHLVVSGGAINSSVNEGNTMRQWLIDQGIVSDRITVDPTAKDTVGNILAFSHVIREYGYDNICLISSLSHTPRAWMGLVLNLYSWGYQASVKAAAPELPGSSECPGGELSLTYTTVIRAGRYFSVNDFQ